MMKLQNGPTQSHLCAGASAVVAELDFKELATQLFNDGAEKAASQAVLGHVFQEGDDIEHGDGGRGGHRRAGEYPIRRSEPWLDEPAAPAAAYAIPLEARTFCLNLPPTYTLRARD
jgi:hypothetical protein